MAIILVGFMGAGKTTVGRELAQQLGLQHHDLDDLIVKAAGRSIPEIFAGMGDAGFRALEHETLTHAITMAGVLSTGGGAPVQPQNFALLQASQAPVILLEAKPETILARIGGDANRPLVQELGPEGLLALQAKRDPRYHELADLVIETDQLSPVAIATKIANWLQKA